MPVRDPASERRDDHVEQQADPDRIHGHRRRAEDPPPLHDQDVEAERDQRERDVFACQHRDDDGRDQERVPARHGRVQRERDGGDREDHVMKVVDHAREDTPEAEVRRLEGEAAQRSELALAPEVDRSSGQRQEDRLRHEKDSGGAPDPHERAEDHEDRVEVVWPIAARGHVVVGVLLVVRPRVPAEDRIDLEQADQEDEPALQFVLRNVRHAVVGVVQVEHLLEALALRLGREHRVGLLERHRRHRRGNIRRAGASAEKFRDLQFASRQREWSCVCVISPARRAHRYPNAPAP